MDRVHSSIQTCPVAQLEPENVLSSGNWGAKTCGITASSISKEIISLSSVSWDEIKMVSDKVHEQI